MKTLFLTTGLVVSVLTTSVFGAASVRMGSTGMASGGGTLTTARAGSLRTAQSSKTVSSAPSTPSVSIASPTQNTNARLTFVSPVKGLDINKAKENATTKQELNDLGEQIEQLRTQLDAADADNANKIKMEDVERKITEKITELGTSTTAKDTYSKAEVDALVTELQKKTPQIDDRGNLTWNDPNGNLIAIPAYYFNRVQEWNLVQLVNIYKYHTNAPTSGIGSFITQFCEGETDWWCYLSGEIIDINTNEKEFTIIKRLHGYGLLDTFIQEFNDRIWVTKNFYTNEPNPGTYIQKAVCQNKPETDCYISAVFDMYEINNSIQSGLGENAARYQVNVMDAVIKNPGTPVSTYTPLR